MSIKNKKAHWAIVFTLIILALLLIIWLIMIIMPAKNMLELG